MKENKLIAEFMGMEHCYRPYGDGFMEVKENGSCVELEDLQYHESWNWLMPVVESIERLGYEFFIVEDRVKVSHNTDHSIETIIDLTSRSKLNATYNAVVEFINQYNKTK